MVECCKKITQINEVLARTYTKFDGLVADHNKLIEYNEDVVIEELVADLSTLRPLLEKRNEEQELINKKRKAKIKRFLLKNSKDFMKRAGRKQERQI